MTTFDTSELRKLSADLEAGAQRVGRDVSAVVRASADRVKRAGQAAAPVGPTGNLHKSIGVDLYGDGRSGGMTAVVGPSVYYGLFVEHGTSKMAAQPFLGPSLAAEEPRFVAELERAAEVLK